MKLSQIVKYEKEKMPKYMFRFNYWFCLPAIVVMLLGAIAAAALSAALENKYGESFVTVVPFIVFVSLFAVFVAVAVPWGISVRKRLTAERADALGKKYFPLSGEETAAALKAERAADANGFYRWDFDSEDGGEDDMLGNIIGTVPFDECRFALDCSYWSSEVLLSVIVTDRYDEIIYCSELGNGVYNYMIAHKIAVKNADTLTLLENYRTEFVKLLMKNQKAYSLENKIDGKAQKRLNQLTNGQK